MISCIYNVIHDAMILLARHIAIRYCEIKTRLSSLLQMVNTRNGQHSGSEPHANGAPPPPELATLVVQQAELIRLLTEERQGRGQLQPREPRNRGISYKDFEELRPPVFTKCPEPLDADDWLRTIKSKFTPSRADRATEGAVCRTVAARTSRWVARHVS